MGVPTVVLEGDWHAARVGHSLNWMVGYQNWSASNLYEYVSIATNAAVDSVGLRKERKIMRDKVKKSILCDGLGFARKLERAYDKMWRSRLIQV
jgi:protein O-GlcNAc transferase